ncbi:MAG TPA: ANTAR domain-containing protein [Methylomirabilota bacterium]
MGVLDSDAESRAEVSRLIESRGATVVLDAAPRPDAVALLCHVKPDAVMLAAEDATEGVDAVTDLFPSDLLAPVVLIAGPATVRALEPGRIDGVMGVLLRPLRPEELRPTLEVAIARFRELRRLRRILADRPVIEQAKAALMSRDGLSEPAAFSWLRRRAMDQRMQMGEVARAVLADE